MKEKKKIWVIAGIALVCLIGVGALLYFCVFDPAPKYRLTVTIRPWTGWTTEQPSPEVEVYDPVKTGTVLYDDDKFICKSITVDKVAAGYIRLKLIDSCFVGGGIEPAPGSSKGEIDMLKVPLGEKIEIMSETMDAGVIIYFELEEK